MSYTAITVTWRGHNPEIFVQRDYTPTLSLTGAECKLFPTTPEPWEDHSSKELYWTKIGRLGHIRDNSITNEWLQLLPSLYSSQFYKFLSRCSLSSPSILLFFLRLSYLGQMKPWLEYPRKLVDLQETGSATTPEHEDSTWSLIQNQSQNLMERVLQTFSNVDRAVILSYTADYMYNWI